MGTQKTNDKKTKNLGNYSKIKRLKTLLYTAIVLLEDYNAMNNFYNLFDELGITQEEYTEIMGR